MALKNLVNLGAEQTLKAERWSRIFDEALPTTDYDFVVDDSTPHIVDFRPANQKPDTSIVITVNHYDNFINSTLEDVEHISAFVFNTKKNAVAGDIYTADLSNASIGEKRAELLAAIRIVTKGASS